MSCCLKWHCSRLTCCTLSTQSRSWIRRIVSQGIRQSSSSRYNGATTLKKKQLGKVRIFSVLAIQTLSYRREGTCDCSLSLYDLFSFQISGQDFILGWGGLWHPVYLILMTKLITCLIDTKSWWNSKLGFNFKVFKFCIVWTIKLSLQFIRINWNRIRPYSQKRKCSSRLVLQVCKLAKILELRKYFFLVSKQSSMNQFPRAVSQSFCLTICYIWNVISPQILGVRLCMSPRL
jgi:hypothetical protein